MMNSELATAHEVRISRVFATRFHGVSCYDGRRSADHMDPGSGRTNRFCRGRSQRDHRRRGSDLGGKAEQKGR